MLMRLVKPSLAMMVCVPLAMWATGSRAGLASDPVEDLLNGVVSAPADSQRGESIGVGSAAGAAESAVIRDAKTPAFHAPVSWHVAPGTDADEDSEPGHVDQPEHGATSPISAVASKPDFSAWVSARIVRGSPVSSM